VNEQSISVILPVYNRQNQIFDRIEDLLEDLSVLSDKIEVLLVDDGSEDATPEVLDELRRRYPQVAVLRHTCQLGPSVAVQTGMKAATGDYVFAQESYEPLLLDDLKKLWKLRGEPGVLMARARTRTRRIDQTLLQKLTAWGKQVEEAWQGKPADAVELQMYCRNAIQKLEGRIQDGGELEVAHTSHRRLASPNFPTSANDPKTNRSRASRWTE
jgi:glycosyltransferase involved in cell wall biosynthesis